MSEDPWRSIISSCVLGVLCVKDGGDDENGGLIGSLNLLKPCHSDYHWIPEKPAEAMVIITRVYRQTWATRRLEMHQAGIAGISQPLRVETASVGKV